MFSIAVNNKSMSNYYATVVGSKTINSRLSIGSNANLELYEDGWLIKADKPGFDLIPNEFKCLIELQDSNLVPEVDEESFDGSSFVLKEVAYGTTLDEYCRVCPDQVLTEIFSAVGKLLDSFWSLGFVHRDLHSNNILIGKAAGEWRPYLIDFGHSYCTRWSKSDLRDYCDSRGDILQELPDWEADLERLQEALPDVSQDVWYFLEKEISQ